MAGPLGVAGGSALVIVAGLGAGAACGVIVVRLGLPAIVVTLAASFIIGGGALLILPRPGGTIPAWLSDWLAGDTPVAALLVVLAVMFWKLYLATPLGLSLYAAGENPDAAYRAGVPVDAARIAAYAVSGLLSTCAGLFVAAKTGSGDPVIGEAFTLNSIAAAVLGGVGFLGGRGAMRGALAGSLLLSVMINVMYFLGFPPVAHYIAQGLIIIGAVALPEFTARRSSP
jgi:ribose transport system permease protein